jgi:hypothetical protein
MSEKTKRNTPKDVFLHLFNIFTFYLSVIAFITLYVQYVEAAFPDPLQYYFSRIAGGVRWSTSVLFVSVPAYIFTSWLFAKDFVKNPASRDFKLRKWLVYFTLFISAITIIIDLMIFVYNFLDGEMTIQFFLKILIVLFVAGAVFGYYIWDLKRKDLTSKTPKTLAIIMSVVVLVSIIVGFFVVGTPADQRMRRFDEERVSDLQMIQSEIIVYWKQKEALPENLLSLENDITGFRIPTDPDTEKPYEYRVVGDLKFELCATFQKESDKNAGIHYEYYSPYDAKQNWEHKAGRFCFEREIDPDLYKKGEYIAEPIPVRRIDY